LIIILLFGYILYSQIRNSTYEVIEDKYHKESVYNKKAEKYTMETSIELNN